MLDLFKAETKGLRANVHVTQMLFRADLDIQSYGSCFSVNSRKKTPKPNNKRHLPVPRLAPCILPPGTKGVTRNSQRFHIVGKPINCSKTVLIAQVLLLV